MNLASTTWAAEISNLRNADGFDFTRHQFVGHTFGDFYIYQGQFFADAPTQHGLIDLGDCQEPAQFIDTLPDDGYEAAGVAITAQHCYGVIPRGTLGAPRVVIKVISSFPEWTTLTYVIEGTYCSAIDECDFFYSPAGCATDQECVQRNGIFACVENPCAQGSAVHCGPDKSCQLSSDGRGVCSGPAIDECATGVVQCDPGYVCENKTGGKYYCVQPEP